MRFRSLAVILLVLLPLLPSCHSGGGSSGSVLSAGSIRKAATTNRGNPFQVKKKSWLRDKTDRLGITGDKPPASSLSDGASPTEVFRSNQ